MTGSAFADTGAANRTVAWSSFNKPVRIADALGLAASEFVYGPSRARIRQTVFEGAAVTRTVTYVGTDFERRAPASGPAELVHYIRAGGTVVAEVTKTDDGNPATDRTRWLHRDHLGSVALVTDEAGAVAEDRSFGPWGEARNADWLTPASPPPLLESPRGFTGHEHISAVGLIHMNGRVYDPKIGRFMSPDSSDALAPGVGFNRYAYVKNNPVSLTDPSGFEFGTSADRGYEEDHRGLTSRGGGFKSSWDVLREHYETPGGQRHLNKLDRFARSAELGRVRTAIEESYPEDLLGIGGALKGLLKAAFRKVGKMFAKKADNIALNNPLDISTAGRTSEEAAAMKEYARRTNGWLAEEGPQTIQSTAGDLRRGANAAARRERQRAAREGAEYGGQAGHVPDSAISGTADPPGGWMDMPGVSNSCCGGVLGSRVGSVVDHIRVDGQIP